MSKKKATKKKKAVPHKRIALKKKPLPPDPDAIDLDSSNDTLKFNIRDDKGELLGVVEDSCMALHRHVMIAQGQVQNERQDYIEFLAVRLTAVYKVTVSTEVAYKMAAWIFEKFGDVKKNYHG